MSASWKLSVEVAKPVAEAALAAQELAPDWDADIVLTACEIDEQHPDDWLFEAWLPRKPKAADRRAVAALFDGGAPDLVAEQVPETDWVTESQQRVPPIRAGRFHVHTPDYPPDPDAVDLVIPASQAFGTGQHATTAGCLAMLDLMKREGLATRNHADIGTGTGLLAFAAMRLWPHALATASDIDPVCTGVLTENARNNGVPLGGKRGELLFTVADGMDDPLLKARAPFDLLIANILAGPLAEMAQDFAAAVTPGGSIVLAGLLETQEAHGSAPRSRATRTGASRQTASPSWWKPTASTPASSCPFRVR